MPAINVEQRLTGANVRLVAKSESQLMRTLGKVLFFNPRFMTDFWTVITLGSIRIIAYPTKVKSYAQALTHTYTILHELEHVRQADNALPGPKILSNIWYSIQYLFLFTPAIFAYYRYNYEVEAYLIGFRERLINEHTAVTRELLDDWVEHVATGLWRYYFFTVPPFVTRKRLKRELKDLYTLAAKFRYGGPKSP